MQSGLKLLKYDKQHLIDSPNEFETDILFALKCGYSQHVNEIFASIKHNVSSEFLCLYKNKIELHLFPALVLPDQLGLDKNILRKFALGLL